MSTNITNRINDLQRMSRQELLGLWRALYGMTSPPEIRREILIPFLAYRLQEKHYGGLKASTRSELLRIARRLDGKQPDELQMRPRIKCGTRLRRSWQGQTHEVTVTESGFKYLGGRYRSLSEVARKITGTRWSGPAFFGLRKAKSISK